MKDSPDDPLLIDRVAEAMWLIVNERKLLVDEGPRPPRPKIGVFEWSIYQRMARAAIETIQEENL